MCSIHAAKVLTSHLRNHSSGQTKVALELKLISDLGKILKKDISQNINLINEFAEFPSRLKQKIPSFLTVGLDLSG